MKKERGKQFGALMAVLILIVFAILVLTFSVIALTVYTLMHFGVITVDIHLDFGPPVSALVFFFLLVSIVIGLCISLAVTFLPVKGLNILIVGLGKLADGDFTYRINEKRIPIAKDIAESFNALAEELEGTEMLRSDFVNNFSHEIKTPIVSIRGFARLLQKQELTDKQREYVDIIEQEASRTADMTQKILNLTKVENQTILTDVSSYNLSEQLRQCCLLMIDRAEKKKLEIQANFPETYVCANSSLMQEVWVNLLDNAVKFSPGNGTVSISIESVDGSISVIITNPSAPVSDDTRIFQKFYQGDTSHSKEGTGIGLSIVKRIVQLHGGSAIASWDNGMFSIRITLPQK